MPVRPFHREQQWLLPPERLRLHLDYDGARGRVIVVRADGGRYDAIVRRLRPRAARVRT